MLKVTQPEKLELDIGPRFVSPTSMLLHTTPGQQIEKGHANHLNRIWGVINYPIEETLIQMSQRTEAMYEESFVTLLLKLNKAYWRAPRKIPMYNSH